MKKLGEIQENKQKKYTDYKFNELRYKVNEQKEYFTKGIGTFKKNQVEIFKNLRIRLHNGTHEAESSLYLPTNLVYVKMRKKRGVCLCIV